MNDSTSMQPACLPQAGTTIAALDGIRGIAILLVMLHHFTLYGGIQPILVADKLICRMALAGWCGVDLFFVLSGFLITRILFDTKDSPSYFRNFYARRVLRIFPLYFGTLFAIFIILPLLFSPGPNLGQVRQDQFWYWTFLVNIQIAVTGWPSSPLLGHFWSLAVEEQFYLVWPFVVYALSRRGLLGVCVLCFIGSLALRTWLHSLSNPTAAYVLMPTRADALASGALILLVARSQGGMKKLASRMWWVLLAAAAALLIIVVGKRGLDSEDPVVGTLGITLLAILFGATIAASITTPQGSALQWLLCHPALRFCGRYSYAMYVFHMPVTLLLTSRAFDISSVPRLMGSQIPGLILFTAVAGSLTVGISMLSWHCLESPFLKLKKHFAYQSQRPAIRQ